MNNQRVAVVVGGASGIGWATARVLAAEGARVTIADRNTDGAHQCAGELGDPHSWAAVEVTDEAAVARLFDDVVAREGGLDVVVNCAGFSGFGMITDLDAEQFRSVVDVCLTGGFLVIKHAGRHLHEGGTIVSLTSLNARQPAIGMSAYCAAKAGLSMLTEVAALELGPRGIRVNAVAPGFVHSPLTEGASAIPGVVDEYVENTAFGRAGTPEDVAATVAFLCSAQSSWMTGEVLVLASKPDYDLAKFAPRLSHAEAADITARGAWTNLAISGAFPPGSTFKILTSIAGMRAGVIDPDEPLDNCQGTVRIGNRTFVCNNARGRHGEILLPGAIAQSCDIYYFAAGRLMTHERLAAEGRRFHLHERTGIELPNETRRMIMPDSDYKERVFGEKWFPGDTANASIGQGYVLVSPLQMACFAASVARNEVHTPPTLVHRPDAPTLKTESIGLTPAQRSALVEGMVLTVTEGTAKALNIDQFKIPGVRLAGKTGTAQKVVTKDGKTGIINYAWFICFAPADNPEIAMAVMIEGDTIGEEFGGGRNAGPVAATVIKKYFENKNRPADQKITPFRTE